MAVIADIAGPTTNTQLTRKTGYSTITTTNLMNETTTNHLQPTSQSHHTSVTRVSRRSSISIRKSIEEDVATTPITTTSTKLNDIILLSNNNDLTYGIDTPPALRGASAAGGGRDQAQLLQQKVLRWRQRLLPPALPLLSLRIFSSEMT
ncbi:unnamed protein product [Didymodactylos carnosus]|uniref:Uncharacterized protein n=1 Tax=Didymodactylos carnosus TaxID=1234261 RepID=A0A8S2HVS6_9BILA|nr:unnamed protein product [Didymodactylos carnosus]CAF3689018.1 unnamed protein product [Didymodactylos carnosus]